MAPAARSRPSSRTRSATVIERVLKIRNEPTNRATAAISAVVERKSAVELAERCRNVSRGRQHVRLAGQGEIDRGRHLGRGRPLPRDDVDPADGVVAEDPLHRPERQDDGPAGRADDRAITGHDPHDRQVHRRAIAAPGT